MACDFSCKVCGAQCPIAPDLPERAVCEAHCEEHDYQYNRDFQEYRCVHCDKWPGYDYLEPLPQGWN